MSINNDNESSLNNNDKEKLKDFYLKTININEWLNNKRKTSIIRFKDRVEYKMNQKYHRLNGPAIDYNDDKLNQYYYKGQKFDTQEEWNKITLKEIRRIKIKKISNEQE